MIWGYHYFWKHSYPHGYPTSYDKCLKVNWPLKTTISTVISNGGKVHTPPKQNGCFTGFQPHLRCTADGAYLVKAARMEVRDMLKRRTCWDPVFTDQNLVKKDIKAYGWLKKTQMKRWKQLLLLSKQAFVQIVVQLPLSSSSSSSSSPSIFRLCTLIPSHHILRRSPEYEYCTTIPTKQDTLIPNILYIVYIYILYIQYCQTGSCFFTLL